MSFSPVSNTHHPRSPADQWPDLTYIVRPNEDLNDIAQRYGVSVEQLLDANPILEHVRDVRTGQQISIPARPEASEQPLVDVHDGDASQSMTAVASQHGIPLAKQNPSVAEVIDSVHDGVGPAGDMQAQLKELNKQYFALPAPLQTKLLADHRTKALFDSAARYANEPLSKVSSDPKMRSTATSLDSRRPMRAISCRSPTRNSARDSPPAVLHGRCRRHRWMRFSACSRFGNPERSTQSSALLVSALASFWPA